MARFVILEAVWLGVNRWGETLCLEVPQFELSAFSCRFLAISF
jgi:hypothetical protein